MKSKEIGALQSALYDAMDGAIQMKSEGWTCTATVNLAIVAERLYLRGVRHEPSTGLHDN
ncbi:MAG TPA: hypothetical protein VGP44_12785 [Gemmatimonadales bacterium]|nr:hypothetical protein [Gemmatimonadales bacterium]